MSIKVGTAPAAWGVNFSSDSKQTPWTRYLDEVTEAGYKWTELGPYGYLPTNLKTLKTELNQRQLKLLKTYSSVIVIYHLLFFLILLISDFLSDILSHPYL